MYQEDPSQFMHRGAIYQRRPVFWLESRWWIARRIQWDRERIQGSADIFLRHAAQQAFSLPEEDYQEYIGVRAKERPVVVLSSDKEINNPYIKQVLIAPFYTIDEKRHPDKSENFRANVRNSRFLHTFYLPKHPQFPMEESYIDLQRLFALDKELLPLKAKSPFCFTEAASIAILRQYIKYLETT